jgi:hypothetical protein
MLQLIRSAVAGLQRNARALFVSVCIVWFAVLCVAATVTPQAFVSDESGYLLPVLYGWDLSNYLHWSIIAQYPSYLYFWVYSLLPQHDLRIAAKILNAVFIVATAGIAFAVARRLVSIPLAAAFAGVVTLSPINSFVFFIMPESMYFFGFWLVIAAISCLLNRSVLCAAAAGGVAIGLLSMVKAHAFALTLGAAIFFLLRERMRVDGIMAAVLLFGAYYLTRGALGYPLTGHWQWSVSGSTYGGVLGGGHIDFSAATYNLLGHICALLALVAVPLSVTGVAVVREFLAKPGAKSFSSAQNVLDLGLLALCLLAVMLAMTVYFSQTVFQLDPVGESITRLHGRYYFYALPLFFLVVLGLWQQGVDLAEQCPRWAIFALCTAAVSSSFVIGLVYRVGAVDFPDLALANPPYALQGLLIVPVAGVAMSRTMVASRAVVAVTVWCAIVSVLTSVALVAYAGIVRSRDFRNPLDAAFFDVSDRVGLRQLINSSDGLIIGSRSSASDLDRAFVYLRCRCAGRIVSDDAEIEDRDISGVRWALLLGNVRYSGVFPTTKLGSVMIVREP